MSSLTFGSVCSGIEAASVAWHPLGWKTGFVSEIEPFPCSLLAHHYQHTPNFGDMTKYEDWNAAIDLLVGGTPCQSFSVAGLRKGLRDPRGNLMLVYGAIAARLRPRWLVWENVPGVLSSSGGRDFGAFLGMLAELGYGFAYRVLDAQYFGVPQRRRRVFVVGHLGDWRRAAAVFLERASLRGDPAPRREARETAPTIPSRSTAGGGLGTDFDCDGGLIAPDVVAAMTTRTGTGTGTGNSGMDEYVVADTLRSHPRPGSNSLGALTVAHALRGEGFDASEDGTGRGVPLTVAPFDLSQITSPLCRSRVEDGAPCHTLNAAGGAAVAIGFGHQEGRNFKATDEQVSAITRNQGLSVAQATGVRRLTPRECERLQGFPDDYTLIPHRGKPAADGPRYKALGNSMAVPVMRWIGERIALVDAIA